MNSNQIYEGEMYAYWPGKPRGMTPTGAAKVRANRLKKSKYTYEKNRRTEVEITVVAPGTAGTLSYLTEGRTMLVPARDIIDFWDSYKDEEALLLEERERRNYAHRRVAVQKAVLENLIGGKLGNFGLPHGIINVSSSGDWVTIPLAPVLSWLGITEDEVEEAVKNVLGPPIEDSGLGYITHEG